MSKNAPGGQSLGNAQLAEFQATLLDLLSQGFSPQEVIELLQRDPRLAEFHGYVSTFEPRMIAVAIDLLAKWGRREAGVPSSL